MKWFTSDLHFSHKNIVEFTQRGNDTTQELHDEWLIDLWNNQVGSGDEVWHLGDFNFKHKYSDVASVIRKLNGQKYFLKGNHDDGKTLEELRTNGWITQWYDYKEIKIQNNSVCLFHFPISSWNKQGRGSWMLHGHCHSNFKEGKGKILDVGLDSAYDIYKKHCFFSEENVLEYMKERDVYVSDHHKNTTKR